MDYLDFERVIHTLICILTVLIGIVIGLTLLCIPYEDNGQLAQVINSSREIKYIFPYDRWFNISS